MKKLSSSRRDFIKHTGIMTAGLTIVPSTVAMVEDRTATFSVTQAASRNASLLISSTDQGAEKPAPVAEVISVSYP